MKHCIATIALLTLIVSACSARTANNTPVGFLDAPRYLGNWYEIARFDHSFERGLEFAKTTYTMQTDGSIRVVNSGMKNGKMKKSVGRAKFTKEPGLLRVSFFGPFYSDYRVLMVSDDYNYALVGAGSDKFLWILSRTPQVPQDVINAILREASFRGYETDDLIWVKQKAPAMMKSGK